jgi:hypothetical protein
MMRFIIYIIVGAAALFGSFFITLWLTEPTADDQSKQLAAQRIPTYSDLPKASQNVGLRLSEQMKGAIDQIKRINERDVNMTGWLADPQGNSTPLNLLVFIDGSMVAAGRTEGERPDVTKGWIGFNFASGADKNVAFSLNFNCRTGDQPVVVGVGERNQYIPLQFEAKTTNYKCP